MFFKSKKTNTSLKGLFADKNYNMPKPAPTQCPNCKAIMEIEDGKCKCQYCGTIIR